MRYFFKVMLLLLIISFAGAGTAFYTDTINLDIDTSGVSEETQPLTLEYAFQDRSDTNYLIDLWIDIESEEFEHTQDLTNAFSIKLMSYNTEIADLSTSHNSWVLVEGNDTGSAYRIINEIALDQNALDLPDGVFELTIAPSSDVFIEIIDPITISIEYSSITDYQFAVNESPAPNSTGLRLHFPDESSNYLIPITRFVPQTNTTLRETVRQLESGPSAHMGLFDRSPIPPVPRIQLSGGTASLYLSSQLGFYNEYPNVAKMAAGSLVESLGSIPEVDRIQFYFDNRIVDEGFTGVPTNSIIEPAKPPFLYVVYRASNGRGFLLPSPLNETNLSVSEIIQLLTYNQNVGYYSTSIQPTIPHEVELINFSLENGTLVVDFNQQFNTVFVENPLQGRIMLDSLMFSLTSLEEVSNVLFLVNGEIPEVNIGVSFDSPLAVPVYINPEI